MNRLMQVALRSVRLCNCLRWCCPVFRPKRAAPRLPPLRRLRQQIL